MRKILSNHKGFTLIELLVVVAIMGVLSTALTLTITMVLSNYDKGRDVTIASRQVSNAGYWISRDIQSVNPNADPGEVPLGIYLGAEIDGYFPITIYRNYWVSDTEKETRKISYELTESDDGYVIWRLINDVPNMLIAQYLVDIGTDTKIVEPVSGDNIYVLYLSAKYKDGEKQEHYEAQVMLP